MYCVPYDHMYCIPYDHMYCVSHDLRRSDERLVLLYREGAEAAAAADSVPPDVSTEGASAELRASLRAEREANLSSALRVMYFRDVPMADMEVVYPEKTIEMSTADKTMLALTFLIGVLAVAYKVLFDSGRMYSLFISF